MDFLVPIISLHYRDLYLFKCVQKSFNFPIAWWPVRSNFCDWMQSILKFLKFFTVDWWSIIWTYPWFSVISNYESVLSQHGTMVFVEVNLLKGIKPVVIFISLDTWHKWRHICLLFSYVLFTTNVNNTLFFYMKIQWTIVH